MTIWQKIKYLNRQRNYKTKKIKDAFKIQLLYSLNKIKKGSKRRVFSPDKYENILLFMHSLVVLSGFIHELKTRNKNVTVIAEKKLMFLFEDLIYVDEFIEFDPLNFSTFKNKVKNQHYDLIIDFAEMDVTIIRRLRSLLVINHEYALSYNQPRKTVFDMNIVDKENRHISERMLDVLKLLNIYVKDYQYILNIKQDINQQVDTFLANEIKNNKLIIFNPFASLERRSLSLDQIYSLLDFFENMNGYTTIVFDCSKTVICSNYSNVISNPFESFMASACLVKKSDFVITVDTSIVHLSRAFNKPQLAIYNNRLFNNKLINNIVWGPNYSKAIQITTKEHLNTEEGDKIANLDVSFIIEKIKELIKI